MRLLQIPQPVSIVRPRLIERCLRIKAILSIELIYELDQYRGACTALRPLFASPNMKIAVGSNHTFIEGPAVKSLAAWDGGKQVFQRSWDKRIKRELT